MTTTDKAEKLGSQDDEYSEYMKVSPTCSYSTTLNLNNIPQIKSSQSCRNTDQENQNPAFVNNNLCSVKESEEEQMTETFNKKFAQPQQKDISKKNTPRQKHKITNNGGARITSRGKANSGENTNRILNSRSKSNAKKADPQITENLHLNFNVAHRMKLKQKNAEPTIKVNHATENDKNLNLPSIVKNSESAPKFEYSLVGFDTRSLSKNGTLKIKKGKISVDKSDTKMEPSSGTSLNSKNSLINVPKKYQYRGKRLNADIQSISSSAKSGMSNETFKNNQVMHTKSGPIQTKEAL